MKINIVVIPSKWKGEHKFLLEAQANLARDQSVTLAFVNHI